MATISTTDIILAVAVFTPVLVVLVYAIRRLRRQREKLKRDIANQAIPTEDRAYNQLAFSRSELTVLQREGFDTQVPSRMLNDAQAQLDRREYGASLKLSRDAHETMVRLRANGPNSGPTGVPGQESLDSNPLDPPIGMTAAAASVGVSRSTDSDAARRDPPNRSEAHFQLNLLAGELEALRNRRPNDPRLAEGDRLFRAAQTSYQGGEFTESLRLGLRGRRTIGTQVESLPSSVKAEAGRTASSASSLRCAQCGMVGRSDDQYCRRCGSSLKVAACPRCEKPLHDGDRFCGVCGSPTLG